MWIEGPVNVRGTSTYLLHFDSRIRIAFIPAASRSSSWFDPLRGSSLRFFKHEQNPLTRHDESVDFYPDQREWKSASGERVKVRPTRHSTSCLSCISFGRSQ